MQVQREATRPAGDIDATAVALLETVPTAMRAIRAQMRANRGGLSVPQFRAMLYVRRNPGTGLSHIADHLGTSVPATSELVSRLVTQGLVLRVTDPDERRRIKLTLSADGERHLEQAQAATVTWLRDLLAGMDAPARRALADGMAELRGLVAAADQTDGTASLR